MAKANRKTVDVEKMCRAFANYVKSEGCDCCQGHDHDEHAEVIAKLLGVPEYADGSGYDFYRFADGRAEDED